MNDQIHNIRHSLAHLLAMAVLKYDPEVKLAIGPVIENGFYYDFEFSEGKVPTEKDLKDFTKQMKKMASSNIDFIREEVDKDTALEYSKNQPYKIELINDLVEKNANLSVYKSGDFVDLCSGPHVKNTKEINPDAFELTKIAGAYWRGDEKNKMLTRIYGVAFETKEELENYKKQIAEAAERDHRKIGKELGLWTFSDLVGAGLPLFTPKGTALRNAIISKIHKLQSKHGYKEVWIPHITKPELYKTSGHWEKFGDELFKVQGRESEFVMKPMNCPHHTQIFASEPHSYKDLPIRYTEATTVYRDEQSGELIGLGRVRSITQDDGHVFCAENQIADEITKIVDVIKDFYTLLDMYKEGNFWVSLSVRDPETPEKYLGSDDVWKHAEKVLEEVAKSEKLPYQIKEGEAAFYGPKLDFMFKDSLGRERQLATVQLDFNMPNRFALEYTDKDGTKKTPVMIHRAIAGSLERFLAIVIEHFAGEFPLWLSPVQIKVIPVAESHNEYAESVFETLKETGLRAEFDSLNDSLGKKVRNAKKEKVPYFVILGDKEVESKTVTLEGREGNLGSMSLDDLISKLNIEIK